MTLRGMNTVRLDFNPKGRVLKAFQKSDASVRGIMGPVGSAKTSTCCVEVIRRGMAQEPSPRDGIRRTKWVFIRDTYRNLERTTIPTWLQWVPKEAGTWRGGGNGEPAFHEISLKLADGTRALIEVMFVAIGDNDVEDVLRGYEITGAYINEMDRLSVDVLRFIRGRIGRYPSAVDGGPTWYGVWGDCNAPDEDNYVYEDFVETLPEGWEFFVQPSGFSPDAENIENLPAGYYEEQAKGQPDWYIRRMIENRFGYSRDGKPVYPEFDDNIHVAKRPIEAMEHKLIMVGLDAGRTPSAVFQQIDNEGQMRWIGELVCQDVGAQAFGKRLSLHIAERYPGLRLQGSADPSAAYPSDLSNDDDQAWIQIVANEVDIPIKPAPTNKPLMRQEAVRQPLTRMITSGKPGFLLCPTCKVLRRGFNSKYRYKRIKLGGTERYDTVPEKNEWSHPHDAGQYAALRGGDYSDLLGRQKRRGQSKAPKVAPRYDPMTLRQIG